MTNSRRQISFKKFDWLFLEELENWELEKTDKCWVGVYKEGFDKKTLQVFLCMIYHFGRLFTFR